MRYGGAFKYKTRFKGEWTKIWPFIAIPEDPYSVWCNLCSKTVSIGHQGAADIYSHVQYQVHTR